MVLDGDLGELLECGAVVAHVLHAGLAEDGGHEAGADDALGGDAPAAALPGAEEAHLAHLLGADGDGDIVGAGGDGHVGFAEGGGAGGAGVSDIDDRDAGLADLLEDALPDHRVRLVEVAGHEDLDVLHGGAGVLQGEEAGLRGQLLHALLRVAAELDHAYPNDGYISHVSPSFSRLRAGVATGRSAPAGT